MGMKANRTGCPVSHGNTISGICQICNSRQFMVLSCPTSFDHPNSTCRGRVWATRTAQVNNESTMHFCTRLVTWLQIFWCDGKGRRSANYGEFLAKICRTYWRSTIKFVCRKVIIQSYPLYNMTINPYILDIDKSRKVQITPLKYCWVHISPKTIVGSIYQVNYIIWFYLPF